MQNLGRIWIRNIWRRLSTDSLVAGRVRVDGLRRWRKVRSVDRSWALLRQSGLLFVDRSPTHVSVGRIPRGNGSKISYDTGAEAKNVHLEKFDAIVE